MKFVRVFVTSILLVVLLHSGTPTTATAASALTHTLSTAARLLLEPVDTVVNGPENVVLNCAASRGRDPSDRDVQPKISWKRDGKLIGGGGASTSILANGSLLLNSRQGESPRSSASARDEEGQYQCVATWPGVGSLLSRSAKLQSAWLAHFDEEPQESNIVVVGQTARFGCSAQGQPPPLVQWIKDEAPLRFNPSRMSLLPSGTLEIRGVTTEDGGVYKCNVSNTERTLISRPGRLSIGLLSGRKGEEMAPVFTVLPKSQTVTSSSSVLFECSAVGHPLPSISWLKNGITLTLNSSSSDAQARIRRLGHGNLQITNVAEGDGGTYQCRAENSEDSVDVSATLQVQLAPKAEIRSSTLLYSHEKEDVDLECSVVGVPPPQVQWYKNADMISEGDYFQLDNNGLTLRILGLVSSDSGLYQCFATNAAGNSQAGVQLVVLKSGQTIPNRAFGSSPTTTTSSDRERLGAPRDLAVASVTSSSVTLSWKGPTPYGRDAVLGYAVYYKEIDSDRERVLNITQPSFEQVHVQGLQANKKYTFRIVAYSAKGFGESSRPLTVSTQPQRESETPSAPSFVKAWPVSSTGVGVQWAPPSPTPGTSSSSDLKYKIYYTELPTEQLTSTTSSLDFSGRRNRLQRTHVVSSLEAVLEDLRVFTDYSIAVAAINRHGREGPKSRPIRVQTLSEAPGDTPLNFEAEALSSTTVGASWDPPSPEFQNGVITGYKIKYKQKGRKKAVTLTTDANVKSTTVSGLERGSEYQLKIAALNINGSGPYTDWVAATTLAFDLSEDVVPDKPLSIRAAPQSTAITISWSPPRNAQVLVRGYTIGWGRGIPDVYTKLVDGKKRSFTLEDLEPKSDYVISLRAYNQQGDGVPIYENVRTKDHQADDNPFAGVEERGARLSPPVGLRALTLSTTAIHLQWTDSAPVPNNNRFMPEPFGGGPPRPAALYIVKYVAVDETGGAAPRRTATLNTTESSVTIQNLAPNTVYEFMVKAVLRGTKLGSEWSLVASNKTFSEGNPFEGTSAPTSPNLPDEGGSGGRDRERDRNFGPQDVTLLALTNAVGISSVVINWQPPPITAGGVQEARADQVRGYVIRYTTNPSLSEWMEENTMDDVLTHQVYGLTPDTVYYFQVLARHSKGVSVSSEPSPIKSVRTPMTKSQSHDQDGGGVHSRSPPPSNEIVLYLLIALSLLFALASLVLCLYYRNRGTDSSSNGSPNKHGHGSLTKKGRATSDKSELNLNPPDLWIHHDKMELKGVRGHAHTRTRHDSSPSPGDTFVGSVDDEKVPLQQNPNYSSLKKQAHSHNYALSSPSSYTSNEVKYPTLGGKTAHYGPSSIASESSTNTNASQSLPQQQQHNDQHNTLTRRQFGGGGGGLGMPGGANLKSFAVPLPPTPAQYGGGGTLQHQHQQQIPGGGMRQFSTATAGSPVRRISTSNIPNIYSSPPNQFNMGAGAGMGMGMPGAEEGPGMGQKCYSTEELSLEISNLEGLMKDLNAITANEFQC